MSKTTTKIEVYGAKGMKSKPWRRTFASQAAFEKWAETDAADDVTVYGFRKIEN